MCSFYLFCQESLRFRKAPEQRRAMEKTLLLCTQRTKTQTKCYDFTKQRKCCVNRVSVYLAQRRCSSNSNLQRPDWSSGRLICMTLVVLVGHSMQFKTWFSTLLSLNWESSATIQKSSCFVFSTFVCKYFFPVPVLTWNQNLIISSSFCFHHGKPQIWTEHPQLS